MSEILIQRRAMRRAVARSVIVVAWCAFAAPFGVAAQATAKTPAQSKPEYASFLLLPQVQFGSPLRTAAGGLLFIPTKPWRCGDGLCGAPGIEMQALAGVGGWRVAGGVGEAIPPLWFDVLGTVTRTRSTPRRASPDSTYLGAEASFSVPVFGRQRTFVSVRPAVGFGTRVGGTDSFGERTTYMWNVGATVLLPNFNLP